MEPETIKFTLLSFFFGTDAPFLSKVVSLDYKGELINHYDRNA